MSLRGSQYSAYGAMPQHLEAGLSQVLPKQIDPKRRMQVSGKAICTCLWFPWLLFSILYADVTFGLHYRSQVLCWTIVGLGALAALAIGAVAWQKAEDSRSTWLPFLFLSSTLAVTAGATLGNLNFWTNMQAYYDLQTLNVYENVSPRTNHGQQMMDAGKVTFAAGTKLDLAKAFQFQDLDTYCVAPISAAGNSTMSTYDFWAVGLNCCGRNATKQVEYRCGQYRNSQATQGLRLMDGIQRDYFKLAVQQAEAQFKITAKHPIFFYWTEDATADMMSYWDYGFRYYVIGVAAFFLVQIFLIVVAIVLFSKFEF